MNLSIQLDPHLYDSYSKQIMTVVLTGGPCAGKTSLMERFRNEVETIPDVKVFFAKEAATLLKESGINFKDAGGDDTFQRLIINLQLIAEHNAWIAAIKFAKNNPNYKVIIVCDRGIMDGEAYFEDKNVFMNLLGEFELTKKSVYKRYDMVLFLRSAAVGAKQFYTTLDGTPRDESLEEAIALDSGTYNAWYEHNTFYSVENCFKFYDKLDVATRCILKAAGIEELKNKFKRYLIQTPNLVELLTNYNIVTVNEQIFFLNSKLESNVSYVKIQRNGNEVRYSKKEVRLGMVQNEEGNQEYTRVFERESTLTENNFLKEMSQLNPYILPLNRTLLRFTCGVSIRCELEMYSLSQNQMILKVYMDSEKDYNTITSHFKILKDVTNDFNYSTLELARTACEIFRLGDVH